MNVVHKLLHNDFMSPFDGGFFSFSTRTQTMYQSLVPLAVVCSMCSKRYVQRTNCLHVGQIAAPHRAMIDLLRLVVGRSRMSASEFRIYDAVPFRLKRALLLTELNGLALLSQQNLISN